LRIAYHLHRRIIHDNIVKSDVSIRFGDLSGYRKEKPIGEFHDIGFMYGGNRFAVVGPGIFKGIFNDAAGAEFRYQFEADADILAGFAPGFRDEFKHFLSVGSAPFVFNACIKVLGISRTITTFTSLYSEGTPG